MKKVIFFLALLLAFNALAPAADLLVSNVYANDASESNVDDLYRGD